VNSKLLLPVYDASETECYRWIILDLCGTQIQPGRLSKSGLAATLAKSVGMSCAPAAVARSTSGAMGAPGC